MITQDDIIYMIVTDRFEVGDRSRNLPLDPGNPMRRHGGNLLGITRRMPYPKAIGTSPLRTSP